MKLNLKINYDSNENILMRKMPSSVTFYNIIDFNFEKYSNPFFYHANSEDFSITFNYNPLLIDDNINYNFANPQIIEKYNDFSYYWLNLKKSGYLLVADKTYISFSDKDNVTIAEGHLTDFEENRENGTVKFVCIPPLIDFLNEETKSGYSETKGYFCKLTDRESVQDALTFRMNQIRRDYAQINDNLFSLPFGYMYKYADLISDYCSKNNIGDAHATYLFKISIHKKDTKRGFFENLGKIIKKRMIYSEVENKFFINQKLLNEYIVKGYVLSIIKSIRELVDDNQDLITEFKISTNTQNLYSNNNLFNQDRGIFINDTSFQYKIWGFAINENNQPSREIINPGDIIVLDNIKYYISEIQYNFETFDQIRSFEALCFKYE